MMMLICIKQHRSNIWSSIHEKFNTFVPNPPFLYPLKISESRKIFWYCQGVEKGGIGNEWVKQNWSWVEKSVAYKKACTTMKVLSWSNLEITPQTSYSYGKVYSVIFGTNISNWDHNSLVTQALKKAFIKRYSLKIP